MAEPTPSFIKRFLWLPIVSGIVLVGYVIYVISQVSAYNDETRTKPITLAEVASTRPTHGSYIVSGGLLNYVYAQAVGFTNDTEKDNGSVYDSYVPYIDPNTKKVIMLVKIPGYSPHQLLPHSDDPPAPPFPGIFEDPKSVSPEIYQDFANRHYAVDPDLPVFEQFGGIDPATLKSRIIMASVFALLLGGGPWLVMYLLSRPKKKTKSFSQRYPPRKVY